MDYTPSNSPIIEAVADLRWLPVNPEGLEIIDPNAVLLSGPVAEQFYEQFRSILAQAGFNKVERMAPPGFPTPIHMPLYRYTRQSEGSPSAVFQIGPGVLSMHRLAPYSDWSEFKNLITIGINALIESRSIVDRSRVFTRITLRYINRFEIKGDGGASVESFLSRAFGISFVVPVALRSEIRTGTDPLFDMQLRGFTTDNFALALMIGPNSDEDGKSVMLDATVATQSQVEWSLEAASNMLDTQHSSLRRLFDGVTHAYK